MPQSNQFSLLRERRFAPFFTTQFLGAFNDNVFRNGLVILITFQGTQIAGMNASELANVAGALFILPYFLFSATAGQLADKYEKSRLFRAIKLLEVALMLLAGFSFVAEQYELLLVVLFLMGCQSTLFGPVKYAYLPQQLETHELIGGNALVESGTYMAIILGLLFGGIAAGVDDGGRTILAGSLVAFALAGYLASRQIPPGSAADPGLRIDWNLPAVSWRIVGFARERKSVFLAILGISWFWFYGSVVTLQVPAYTLVILNGTEEITTILLVAFAVGVGIGALLCERMSGGKIELGLVPFGAIGLTIFAIDLYFAAPVPDPTAVTTVAEFVSRSGSLRILVDLALLGAFGGFYSVPLYALVQRRANRQQLSRIIAANNIINAFFMVLASVMAITVLASGFTIPQLYILLAILNAAVAAYIFSLLPEFLLRFLAWMLTSLLYRIRIYDEDNIPTDGPAVLVCNHVSFVDALGVLEAALVLVRLEATRFSVVSVLMMRSPLPLMTGRGWSTFDSGRAGMLSSAMSMGSSAPEATAIQSTPGIPDFMDWNQITALPWWWEPFNSFAFTLFAIVAVPVAFAFIIGLAMFTRRVGGVYFAIITQAIAAILTILIIGQQGYTGGVNGITDLRTLLGWDIRTDAAKTTLYFVSATLAVHCSDHRAMDQDVEGRPPADRHPGPGGSG